MLQHVRFPLLLWPVISEKLNSFKTKSWSHIKFNKIPARKPIAQRRAHERPEPNVGGHLRPRRLHKGQKADRHAQADAVQEAVPKAGHLAQVAPKQGQRLKENCFKFLSKSTQSSVTHPCRWRIRLEGVEINLLFVRHRARGLCNFVCNAGNQRCKHQLIVLWQLC